MAAEGGPEEGDRQGPVLKSQKSIYYSFVRFNNVTNRDVDIIWLNYEGRRVKYKSMKSGEFMDVNTFVGHPWIFCDSETGERMVAQLKDVFQPTPWNSESRKWPPKRKIINITIPVYTLQDCCLRTIKQFVPSNKIDKLDITEILKEEIYKMFRLTPPVKSQKKKENSTNGSDNCDSAS